MSTMQTNDKNTLVQSEHAKQTFGVVVSVAYFEEVEGARHAAQPVPHVEGGLEAGDDALEQVQHALVHFQPDFLRRCCS